MPKTGIHRFQERLWEGLKLQKVALLLLSLVLVSVLAACGDQGSTLEKAIERGYVTVGFANEKPYAYQTADGELTGEAVEIARVILERLGVGEMRGSLPNSAR